VLDDRRSGKRTRRRAGTTWAGSGLPALLLVVLTAFALIGCGGSSKSVGATTAGRLPRAVSARFESVRACLQKNGVTLPPRKPGERGKAPLPQGVTAAQLQKALTKCSGGGGAHLWDVVGEAVSAGSRDQRFARFAKCMRQHGVKLPPPNTSRKGPVFDSKGIETNSRASLAAQRQCIHTAR
jgi:hypothetical protein